MKTAQLKSTILSIAILFLSAFSYAQPNLTEKNSVIGVELSEAVCTFFEGKGYAIERQDLLPSDSTSFPQNLIIYLSAENGSGSNKNWNDSQIDTIIFDFTQEFAFENLENLYRFTENLKDSALSYTAVILFTANDSLNLIPGIGNDAEKHPNGTQAYTERLGYDDKCAAVVISGKTRGITITPGSGTNVAPLWLVRTLHKNLSSEKESAELPPWFQILYSHGLAPENERTAAFMEKGIPAAGISIANEIADLDMLLDAARELSVLHKENWDKNYLYIKIGEKDIWIPEAVSITLLMIVITAVLLIGCFTGILHNPRTIALRKDIARSWFVYPVIVILVTLLLHLAQTIFSSLAESNPLLLISFKLFTAFIVVFLVFILQISFDIRISLRACGFLMVTSATFNIFVFSGVNIVLMYLFVLELAVVSVSEKLKSTPALIASFLLTMVPVLALVISITGSTTGEKVSDFVIFSWPQDFLFALLMFPTMMQLERIFISTDLLSPNKKLRRRNYVITALVAEIILIALLWSIYGYASVVIKNSSDLRKIPSKTVIKERDFPMISASVSDQEFMELSMRTLTVKSNEKVMRYEISIETSNGVPIFKSNYDYVIDDTNKISFVIPDYPSGNLEIIYSTPTTLASKITVTAFIPDPGMRDIIYKDTFVLTTEAAGEN